MGKSTDDTTNKVSNHREDGEEAIKRASKVVPIDGGTKKEESVENVAPDPNKAGIEKEEKSSEIFDPFLKGMKDRNVANRQGARGWRTIRP